MDDMISRQAAIETLDEQIALCDKALKSFGISMKDEYAVKVEKASLVAYKELLEAIPAADVVSVVRCRKCKYFWTYQCMDSMPIETCELAQTFYNPDLDFCSLAKRREE